jgi:coiled-coil domain-containing protein 22
MEEVDAIILQSLREIGCDIDDEVKLKNLSPEEVYKCIFKLCKNIKNEVDVSSHLPAQMAQRFSAASQLVDVCKSLGFNGDLGYQTILYSNIGELRRILMWLIEHLPKSEDRTDSYHQTREVSRAKAVENEIARKISMDLKKPWVLEFLQPPQNLPAKPVKLEKPNVAESMSEGEFRCF